MNKTQTPNIKFNLFLITYNYTVMNSYNSIRVWIIQVIIFDNHTYKSVYTRSYTFLYTVMTMSF